MSATERASERRQRILNSSSQRLKVASGSSLEDNIHNVEKQTLSKGQEKENNFLQANVTRITQPNSNDVVGSSSSWKQDELSTPVGLVKGALDRFSVFGPVSQLVSSSKVDNLFRPVCFMLMGLLLATTLCTALGSFGDQVVPEKTWFRQLQSVSFFAWFISVELVVNSTKIMSSLSGVRLSRFQQLLAVWRLSRLLYLDLLCSLFGFLGYFRWFRCKNVYFLE